MTKRAAIKQADLRRMATIAKRERVKVEVEIGDRTYRVSPDDDDQSQKQTVQPQIIRL
ncbi:hypothetical protein [Brucella anthropi]|uniref:hypothetical protein n=1 Tax=Brucella anthropi TaxID=529 RepID=UPI002362B80E|nr:hypothetical protein [Brucella anthropi]